MPRLYRLERDGLVDVADDGGQKTYRLTVDGVAALGEWWRTVPAEEPPPRDELMLKVLLAIGHGADHALDVITRQRSALLGLLQARRREARAGRDASLAASLAADALVVRAEADLRWLDRCESRLTRKQVSS